MLLVPSHALGKSSISAPNTSDRRSVPQMGGACGRLGLMLRA